MKFLNLPDKLWTGYFVTILKEIFFFYDYVIRNSHFSFLMKAERSFSLAAPVKGLINGPHDCELLIFTVWVSH